MQSRKKAKANEREKLFQVKRKRSAQKVFDKADMVRDVRLRDCRAKCSERPAGAALQRFA
jgi:hypothetical protein